MVESAVEEILLEYPNDPVVDALKEKIITNCGSIEKRTGRKPEYLRLSAAHSTIIINNTNIARSKHKKSELQEYMEESIKDSNTSAFPELFGEGFFKNGNSWACWLYHLMPDIEEKKFYFLEELDYKMQNMDKEKEN